MTDYDTQVQQVQDALDEYDFEVEESAVRNRLETLIEEYSVPAQEARRSALRKIGEEHGVDPLDTGGGGGGDATVKDVAEISRDGNWISVEVQYVQDWDTNHDSIAQTGLLADESGTVKLTSWEDANAPALEVNKSYRLENVVTDEYQGDFSVQLQESSEVVELDKDVTAGQETTEATGVMVDVNNGSGLIKRCPEDDCTRVVQNDRCADHGEVDGEFDLRLKAVLDDGQDIQSVIFNKEATEEVTGWTLEEAKEEAKKQLDTEVVIEAMLPEIVNRFYRIEGPQYGEYLMAEEFEVLGAPDESRVETLLEGL